MAKVRGVEAKLARLHSLRSVPMSAEVIKELRGLLGDASHLVVAETAALIGANSLQNLATDLTTAFDRLLIEPEKSDKQCRGKIALVEALNKLEWSEPAVFLRGIVHVQEPRWDDPDQDAAGALRAHCALGLARLNLPERVLLLTDLLLDRDHAARTGAARALGATGSLTAVPLLRFKVQIGDREAGVLGECFDSLLTLAFAESLPFVAHYLRGGSEAVQEAAIFALAESRRPEAFAALKEYWPQAPPSLHETVLLALAMCRLPAAYEFLLGVVAQKSAASRAALSALAIQRHDAKLKERVAATVAATGDAALRQWFEKKFPLEM